MTSYARILEWPSEPPGNPAGALWSAAEIARITDGIANRPFLISSVATDSREITSGGLFVAMRGATMDGHGFVEAAFARGATAALVERDEGLGDRPHIRVADSFAALQRLGLAARARLPGEAVVVGVTGSVGKTSVKEAIFAALDRASWGNGGLGAHRSVKSYNNHVGVPLSLARMPAATQYGVFEMGMNHAGEIDALTRQVRPHIAVITAIAPAHIENLGSEEAIADAKAEIFAGLEGRAGKPPIAILPADSPHFARLAAAAAAHGAQVIGFGLGQDADVRLLDAVTRPSHADIGGGSLVTIALREAAFGGAGGERRLCYDVAAAGQHWVVNSLGVMAVARAAGADLGAAGLALAEMSGLAGRGARVTVATPDGGRAVIIDESYNANPASMRAALAVLRHTPARRRIAVLGAMKELGDFAEGLHASLAGPVAEAGVDIAILVGPEMAALAQELGKAEPPPLGKTPRLAHCGNAAEARAALADCAINGGDAILVKGSNSVGLGQLVAALAER